MKLYMHSIGDNMIDDLFNFLAANKMWESYEESVTRGIESRKSDPWDEYLQEKWNKEDQLSGSKENPDLDLKK